MVTSLLSLVYSKNLAAHQSDMVGLPLIIVQLFRLKVWNWFQNRRHSQKAKIARSPDKVKAVTAAAPEPSHPKRAATTSAAVPSGATMIGFCLAGELRSEF